MTSGYFYNLVTDRKCMQKLITMKTIADTDTTFTLHPAMFSFNPHNMPNEIAT